MTTELKGLDAATITSSFTTAVGNTLELFAALLPIALTVFAAVWGIRKAMQFFKASTN